MADNHEEILRLGLYSPREGARIALRGSGESEELLVEDDFSAILIGFYGRILVRHGNPY